MPSTTMGVSGCVQYDADVSCYNEDAHDEGQRMIRTGETSDKGNEILECPKCGVRRAVNLKVVPLRAAEGGDSK